MGNGRTRGPLVTYTTDENWRPSGSAEDGVGTPRPAKGRDHLKRIGSGWIIVDLCDTVLGMLGILEILRENGLAARAAVVEKSDQDQL